MAQKLVSRKNVSEIDMRSIDMSKLKPITGDKFNEFDNFMENVLVQLVSHYKYPCEARYENGKKCGGHKSVRKVELEHYYGGNGTKKTIAKLTIVCSNLNCPHPDGMSRVEVFDMVPVLLVDKKPSLRTHTAKTPSEKVAKRSSTKKKDSEVDKLKKQAEKLLGEKK